MAILSKVLDPLTNAFGDKPMLNWCEHHPRLVLTAGTVTVTGIYLLYRRLTAPQLPPGPAPWPVVGNLFSLSERLHVDIEEYKKIYGDVFTIYMGNQPMVVLASYAAIKEAFLSRGSDFAGRPENTLFNEDLFMDEISVQPMCEKWRRDKKFLMTSLRSIIDLKTAAGGNIVEEMDMLISNLRKLNGEPTDFIDTPMMTATNVMSGVLFNERFDDHDDPRLRHLSGLVNAFYVALNGFSWSVTTMPLSIAKIIERKQFRKLYQANDELKAYIKEQVDEQAQSFEPEQPRRHVVDCYLGKQDLDVGAKLYDTIKVLTPDSTDTVAVHMRWLVLYLILNPHVQEKIHAEISAVVPQGQMVTIKQRGELPYTDAVMYETFRICGASIFSSLHSATKPGLKFRDYDIPKSATMLACFHTVHKDPVLFPDPEKFDPERFLDENGRLVNKHLVLSFCVGTRMCAGESMAKVELFLFLANIMHSFHVTSPPDAPIPSTEPVQGILQYPQPYNVIFNART